MRIIFLITFLFTFTSFASAEIIYLKSGGAIMGKIETRTDQYIAVDMGAGTLTIFYLDQIKKIVPQPAATGQIEEFPESPNQQFTFQFNPPDGVNYKAILKKTIIEDKGKAGGHVQVVTSKSRVNIHRTPTGFTLESVPIFTKVVRDGLEVQDAIVSLLQDFIISYDLDARGQMLAVHGHENLLGSMQARFSSGEVENLSTVFNEQIFTERETLEWNNRFGVLIGRSAVVGESWEETEEYNLPMGGKAILHTKTDVLGQTQCEKNNCLKLRTSYSSEDGAEIEVSGQGIRFIDPATMLIYSEFVERTVKTRPQIPGLSQDQVKITEKKEFIADFFKQKL